VNSTASWFRWYVRRFRAGGVVRRKSIQFLGAGHHPLGARPRPEMLAQGPIPGRHWLWRFRVTEVGEIRMMHDLADGRWLQCSMEHGI